MGRPDFNDATAGGPHEPDTTQGDTTGWLQRGQDTGRNEPRMSDKSDN